MVNLVRLRAPATIDGANALFSLIGHEDEEGRLYVEQDHSTIVVKDSRTGQTVGTVPKGTVLYRRLMNNGVEGATISRFKIAGSVTRPARAHLLVTLEESR